MGLILLFKTFFLKETHVQGRHGRFLAGKDAIVAAISPARRRRAAATTIFYFSKALDALPPVAALNNKIGIWENEKLWKYHLNLVLPSSLV